MAKVLVVDDSRLQVQLVKTALERKGFAVEVAMDAVQAGMQAIRNVPDAIVLDINMPGGSGIEVLKRLRLSTKTQGIPVAIVSGNEDPDVRQVALELGATVFLPKPVDTDQLCDALTRLLPAVNIDTTRAKS